jgi:hypothetical protein
MLRILAVLLSLGGLVAIAIAGYLLSTPSDEEMIYEQKYKETTEKYERAQAAKDPLAKARLLKESEEAASSAKAWGEGARVRRRDTQLGLGVSCAVVLFSSVVLFLTFVGRKAAPAPRLIFCPAPLT